jgi:competence ComEA-like helix-hairpin-helix protein
MNLKPKNRAGHGSLPANNDDFWRLAVLFGLGLLICAGHVLSQSRMVTCQQCKNGVVENDRLVWTTGLHETEGFCQADWLATNLKTDVATLPHLATVHLQEEGGLQVSGLHPRAALFFFQPVPLNQADAETLAALPGVGPVLAGRILAKREELGGFQCVEQLGLVRGIGPKILANLQDRLAL